MQEIARNFAIFPGNTPRKMRDLLAVGNDFSAVLNRIARANHVVLRANVSICQDFNSILQNLKIFEKMCKKLQNWTKKA